MPQPVNYAANTFAQFHNEPYYYPTQIEMGENGYYNQTNGYPYDYAQYQYIDQTNGLPVEVCYSSEDYYDYSNSNSNVNYSDSQSGSGGGSQNGDTSPKSNTLDTTYQQYGYWSGYNNNNNNYQQNGYYEDSYPNYYQDNGSYGQYNWSG